MARRLYYSGAFRSQADRLIAIDPDLAARLGAAIGYLADHGRDAVLPDVRWRLSQSTFRRDSGEVRWPPSERQADHPNDAWRGLFIAATDTSWILFTVLGNKASGEARGNAWYERAIPAHDRIASQAIRQLGLPHTPPSGQEE